MDIEVFKTVASATGVSGLIGMGVWKLIMRVIDAFTLSIETNHNMHKERAEKLELKLDNCEKKHDDMSSQLAQLREDNGVLKGKVQTLEIFAKHFNPSNK